MTTESNNNTPLLDLSTLEPTRPINIDGKSYKMAHPRSFGLKEMNRMQKYGRMAIEWGQRDLSDEELDDMEREIEHIVKVVLPDLPDDILSVLSLFQRIDIARVFFNQMQTPETNPQTPPTETSIGAN